PKSRLPVELGPQLLDHFIGADALIQRLKADENRAIVATRISPTGADGRGIGLYVRIALDDFGNDVLVTNHIVQRDALCTFRIAEEQPGVARGNETFGNDPE